MDEAKNRSRDASEAERASLNIAKDAFEVTASSRLRMSAEAIGDQVRNVNTRLDNIDRVTSSIDYAVRRFQEVDEACANRIKNIGLDFRRSAGLLNTKEKFGGGLFGGIMSDGEKAWDRTKDVVKNEVDYVGGVIDRHTASAVTIGLEVAAIGLSVAAVMTAASTIIGVAAGTIALATAAVPILVGAIAFAGIAYGMNTILDSGNKIYESEANGKNEGKCSGYNFIRDKIIKPHVKSESDAQILYDRTAIGVNLANATTGGVVAFKAFKEARVAKSLIASSRNKIYHLEKVLNKVANKAVKAIEVSKGNVRLSSFAVIKVEKVFDELQKYRDAPAIFTKHTKEIGENIASTIDTIYAGIHEKTYKVPFIK